MKNLFFLSLGLALITFACQSQSGDHGDSANAASANHLQESLGGAVPVEEEEEGKEHEHEHGHPHAPMDGAAEELPGANELLDQTEFHNLVDFFESPERAAWQMPDELIASLGDLEGKTVMDLGAGTGYFAFRLHQAGAKMVAAEVDERFITYLENKRDTLDLPESEFEVRRVFYDDPLADEKEFDIFFTVDTYHHIEKRAKYLKKVFKGIQPGGRFVVVDFKPEDTPHGPPAHIRVQGERIKRELEAAGFIDVTVDSELLPEQNVVTGFRPS